MADYRVISDVSGFLLEQARAALCPMLLRHPEQISQHPPGEQDNEGLLNIYLYGVQCRPEWRPADPENEGQLVVALQYLFYFSRSAQTPLSPATEQQALGRLLEWLAATPTVDIVAIHTAATAADDAASMTLLRHDDRAQQELWSGLGEPMRPGLCVEVGPILIGARRAAAQRVQSLHGEVDKR